MKKTILLMFLAGITTVGYSQFLKAGSVIGGGSFSFYTQKYKDSNSTGTSFSLIPWAGYLAADNLVVGASVEYDNSTGKTGAPSNYKSTQSSVLFGPLVRYYLDQGLFAHGQFGFGGRKDTFDSGNGTSTTKVSVSQYRLGLGYAARISDTVLFEPMIGYYSNTQKDKTNDTNPKSTTSGLFIMGGFTIILKSTQ